MNHLKLYLLSLFCVVLLNACASKGTPELTGLSPQAQAIAIKQYGGVYKVGSPYKIMGKWYYPAEDYNYSEVADTIKDTISEFSSLTSTEINKIRKNAANIAEKALWKHFIQYYYEAYDIALRNAAKRLSLN